MDASTPYELCQQYADGKLARDETLAQLIAWPYVSAGDMRTSPGDDLMVIPEGTVHDVVGAAQHGLIDQGMCEAVLDAVYGPDLYSKNS